jgi:cytidylate kinase
VSHAIIAIDGPAGSGKSTVARGVAEALGWTFLDTGAMYRALTCEALYRGVDVHDATAMSALAADALITTMPSVTINGRDVEAQLRSEPVNAAVSVVALNPDVRASMVLRQREIANAQDLGTVVEGRDITTVVFPDATLKVYLTASLEERSRRRGDESPESVAYRDHVDSTRTTSPLRQAPDAIMIDTTGREVQDVVEEIVECLKNITSN